MNDQVSIDKFVQFLKIKSVSGEGPVTGTYEESASFLRTYADEIGLSHSTLTIVQNKPIIIAKWEGQEPSLPAVVLNSHYDVVPAVNEAWSCDPFSATIDEAGRIFARGTQDMKSVCIQYLEAVRRLKVAGFQPKRTLYLTFVPDEEIGGLDGMEKFLESNEWKQMQPVGIALDEGLANPDNAYTVFYGERVPWWLLVKAKGNTGHGSRFIENTAMSKIIDVCTKALDFRKEQQQLLGHHGGCSHAQAKKLGDVTSINLTMLQGGVSSDGGKTWALNVIPTEAEAGFDVRISPDMTTEEMRARLDKWCAAEGVEWRFAEWNTPFHEHYLTNLDREKNPWWGIFLDVCKTRGVELVPEVFPASTDSRFIRKIGIPAIGFSPIRNTPILLHDHDEFISKDTFLEGIGVYEALIQALCLADKFDGEIKSSDGKRRNPEQDDEYIPIQTKRFCVGK